MNLLEMFKNLTEAEKQEFIELLKKEMKIQITIDSGKIKENLINPL